MKVSYSATNLNSIVTIAILDKKVVSANLTFGKRNTYLDLERRIINEKGLYPQLRYLWRFHNP